MWCGGSVVPIAEVAAMVMPASYSERLQRGLSLWAKDLARFILVEWRQRLLTSLPLLRASFWSDNPAVQSIWVKTRSSSWTSDGDAYGRCYLLGDVVSRDMLAFWPDYCPWLLQPAGMKLSSSGRHGGLPTHRHGTTLLLPIGGPHSAVGRLLAASLGTWYCLEISNVVRDNVEGQRLRHWQSVRTWAATDHDGVFSMAGSSWCGTSSQDGAGHIFNPLAR
jgi:hypothetical protein